VINAAISSAIVPLLFLSFLVGPLLPIQGEAKEGSGVRKLMIEADVIMLSSFHIPVRPEIYEAAMQEPILLLRLWEVYRFSPRYKATLLPGNSIEIEDPTGIGGTVSLAEDAGGVRIFFAKGAINHRLLPHFRGEAAILLGATKDDTGMMLRVEIYIRMNNRFVGFLAHSLFPFVQSTVLRRISSNVTDFGKILGDMATKQRETAGFLSGDDATRLLALLPVVLPP
jgi:hypothetical protein